MVDPGADGGAGGKKKDRGSKEADLDDKTSVEEKFMSGMYTQVEGKPNDIWQVWSVKLLLEGLLYVLLVLNPFSGIWAINQSFWIWRVIQWLVIRYPFQRYGYEAYTVLMYILFSLVLVLIACNVVVATILRWPDHEPGKWVTRSNRFLQIAGDWGFIVFYPVVIDYCASFWNCEYEASPVVHSYFTDKECLTGPHLSNAIVAAIALVLYIPAAVVLQLSCCNVNPTARNVLASGDASLNMRVQAVKALLVIFLSVFSFIPKFQAVLILACALTVFWLNFCQLPFLTDWVNYVWCGNWMVTLFTCSCFAAIVFKDGRSSSYTSLVTMCVLYGFVAAFALGFALTFLYHKWRLRVLSKFLARNAKSVPLRKVHKFANAHEVELLVRSMRLFDVDGVILPPAADLGEFILKAALARMPDDIQVNLLQCNFCTTVRRDAAASRLALTHARKQQPSFVQRYFIYLSMQDATRLKDDSDTNMDMQAHVEFQQRYRRALLGHKDALAQVRELWRLMTTPNVTATKVEAAIRRYDFSATRAERIYKQLVEAYPKNGLIVKRYGRFMEDVRNDFTNATRLYRECAKMGGSTSGIQSMDFDFASQPGKHEFLLSLDINEDSVVIINMQGIIMMVSPGASDMFGYDRKELEGQNVSMLMPAPFNIRHNSYLQHYQDTGEVRILDQVKEVVALHKDRHVFPIEICVTKLSGVGADATFFGLLRHIPFNKREIKAWIAPNGTVLCCGEMFSSLTGIPADDMVGMNIKSMVKEADEFEVLLQRASASHPDDFTDKTIAIDLHMLNKYIEPIGCHVYLLMGGTEQTRLFVMHCTRHEENDENLLVVDEKGVVSFATVDLAKMLGYSIKQLTAMSLSQLLPHPVASMHANWLLDAPPNGPETSCRSGAVVHLVSAQKNLVPVKLQVMEREETSGLKHVARITKASPDDYLHQRRALLVLKYDGTIDSVEPNNGSLFGYPLALMRGRNICDLVDVFGEWEAKTGSRDMKLLLMALLDKENEMPGCSWRAKLSHPDASSGRPPKSVILQADHVDKQAAAPGAKAAPGKARADAEDAEPKVHLILWKTECLVGHMELDAKLRVHSCDPVTGLILGRPSSSLLKKPLKRIVNTSGATTWERLMAVRPSHKKPRSQDGETVVAKLSKSRVFDAKHPDGAPVRVVLQGVVVTTLSDNKQHTHVNIKPELASAGEGADMWAALGLDNLDGTRKDDGLMDGGSQLSGSHSSDESEEQNVEGHGGKGLSKGGLDGLKAAAAATGAGDAESKGSGFVANWVRTVSMDRSRSNPMDGGAAKDKKRTSFAVEEDGPLADWRALAEEMPDEAPGMGADDDANKKKPFVAKPEKAAKGKGDDNKSDNGTSDGGSSAGDDASGFSQSVMSTTVEETLVDSRRGKALRKLSKLVHEASVVKPLRRLKGCTYLILFLAVAIRAIAFVVLVLAAAYQTMLNHSTHQTALCADLSQLVTTHVQLVTYCSGLPAAQRTHICTEIYDLSKFNEKLDYEIEYMTKNHFNTFMGKKPKAKQLKDPNTFSIWSHDDPVYNHTVYLDTTPPSTADESKGLWELGNRFISAAKEILYLDTVLSSADLMGSRAYQFVVRNGPNAVFGAYTEALDNLMAYTWKHLELLTADLTAFLIVEGCVMLPLLMYWMFALVRATERLRLVHWTCMATLPGPVLLTLSNRPLKVSEDTDDESDINDSEAELDDDEKQKQQDQLQQQGARDRIAPTYAKYILFLLPLLVWTVVIVVVYCVSLQLVAAMHVPVGSLNMAMHVLYRFSRMRMVSLMAVSQSTNAARDLWRAELNTTIYKLTEEYDTLMYGGKSETQVDQVFQQSMTASTFYSKDFSILYFGTTRCMRAAKYQSSCYGESSPWYEVTHHGLDVMMQRVLDEMTLMLSDNNTALTHTNPRAQVMYYVGSKDLYDGVEESAEHYVTDADSGSTLLTTLQLATLIVSVILAVAYVYFVLNPYLRLHEIEAQKVAGLLSHVPNEVDIAAHTKKQLRRGVPKGPATT